MECPKCGKNKTSINDTQKFSDHVRRYRKCKSCGLRFRTKEEIWRKY